MSKRVFLPVIQPNGEVRANGFTTQPPAGSWAQTAREMAKTDNDWDAWKDEMKEQDTGI